MIDLYRFKNKHNEYLYIKDGLGYGLTTNVYKALTFDSWDAINIIMRCGITGLKYEHISEAKPNKKDLQEYMNERNMVSRTRLE